MIAQAQAIQVGVLAGIDLAFGGKGKAFDSYQQAILGDEAKHEADGMSDAAKKFFGAGLGGLVPVVKRPSRRKES